MDLDIYSPVVLEDTQEVHEMLNSEERPNKRRRKKSIVWEHFTIEAAGPSRMKACCNHCKKSFAYINGPKLAGTSHLKRHISLGICTGGLQKSEVAQIASGTKTDPPKRRYRTSSGYAGIPFNQDRCTRDLAKMIITHDYPLHIVEHAAFVDFVRSLHPQYNMVSFNTIQGECVSLYLKEKQSLLDQINEIPGRINLTVDLATSNLSIGYAFLTGHFIDREWNLQQRILNVIMLPFPDSEYAFNQAIISCMSDWHLENKLFTLTLDSSHLNESILGNLRGLLPVKNSLLLDGQLLKANCLARLLSRLAQDAMEKVQDSITRIRECVKYVKTSEMHDEKFSELRQQLQVPSSKELVIDDGKKWNTTYEMLVAACELKEVFGCLDTADPIYKINPSVDDWKNVEVLCTYLKLFFEAACILTGPAPPPSNIFYHEVSKIQLELTHAAMSPDPFVSCLTRPLKEKFDQYWKDCFLVLAMAVVMDPRFKMKLVEFSFAKLFGENAGSWIKAVDDGIHELFLDYITPAPPTALMLQGNVRSNHCDGGEDGLILHSMNGSLRELSMDDQSLHIQGNPQSGHLVTDEVVLESPIEGASPEFSHYSSHSQEGFCEELQTEEKKPELLQSQVFLPQVVHHQGAYPDEMLSEEFSTEGVSHFDVHHQNVHNEMQDTELVDEGKAATQESLSEEFIPQKVKAEEENGNEFPVEPCDPQAVPIEDNYSHKVPVEPICSQDAPTEELGAELMSVERPHIGTTVDETVQHEVRISTPTEEIVGAEGPQEIIVPKNPVGEVRSQSHEEAFETRENSVEDTDIHETPTVAITNEGSADTLPNSSEMKAHDEISEELKPHETSVEERVDVSSSDRCIEVGLSDDKAQPGECSQMVERNDFVSKEMNPSPSQETHFDDASEDILMQAPSLGINSGEVSNQEIHDRQVSELTSEMHMREVSCPTDVHIQEVLPESISAESPPLDAQETLPHGSFADEAPVHEMHSQDVDLPPKSFTEESEAAELSSHETVATEMISQEQSEVPAPEFCHEKLSVQEGGAQDSMSEEPIPEHFLSQQPPMEVHLSQGVQPDEMLVMKVGSEEDLNPRNSIDDSHHQPLPHELHDQEVSPQDLPLLSSGDGLSDFEVYISAIGNQHMKSELDQYLEESLLPRVQDFDVLGWWKLNKLKYPTLSQLAADILSIPISTVEPESVFDTANKKIDTYHGSLHPLTLEAIICAKDWLQNVPSSSTDVDISSSVMKLDY